MSNKMITSESLVRVNSQEEKEYNMNKEIHSEMNDDLRPEYDLSQLLQSGVRGKYAERFHAGTNLMQLTDELIQEGAQMGNKRHGKVSREDQVKAIMSYSRKPSVKVEWSDNRRRFTANKANAFFVCVMLDQMQKADRAWEAGEYMVENHFNDTGDFWKEISDTHLSTIRKICRRGYDGQAFALGVKANIFPDNLKSAAKKIVGHYGSDVRKVWSVDAKHVDDIYDRFKEFDGIGDALAKMAQFILVRDYGIAGGRDSKKYLSVKPDVHLQRVLFRLGIAEKETAASVIANVDNMKLRSPADFDWAVWNIGRDYCHSDKPDCSRCPLEKICEKHL